MFIGKGDVKESTYRRKTIRDSMVGSGLVRAWQTELKKNLRFKCFRIILLN